MKKPWIIILAFLGLLVLGAAACQQSPSPQNALPSAEPAAAVSPTAIIPSSTPAPTATPTPSPTATSMPTNTPAPTATETATGTPTPSPTTVSEINTAVPAVVRQSTVVRWQNVVEYSFFSPSRQEEIFFTIYTPPGYEQSDWRYPVLYFLHGSQGSHILFWNAVSREVAAASEDAGAWISQLIDTGQLPPFILVAPKATGSDWGADNEAMVTQELVAAVDGHWRTVSARNGRSLAGFSMGAGGAMRYAARHPDLYCNTMLLAESGTHEAPAVWQENQDAILDAGLQVALVTGELDTRAVTATTAVKQILIELGIPYELRIVPEVPHNFGQIYNVIGLWALQFHASCWDSLGD